MKENILSSDDFYIGILFGVILTIILFSFFPQILVQEDFENNSISQNNTDDKNDSNLCPWKLVFNGSCSIEISDTPYNSSSVEISYKDDVKLSEESIKEVTHWEEVREANFTCENKVIDTRENKSCEYIRKYYLSLEYYPAYQVSTFYCEGNTISDSMNTAGCKECAKEGWISYYLENCEAIQ
jgi:hypothetical protein